MAIRLLLRRSLRILPVLLLIAGVGLLIAAYLTPAYSDAGAYEAEMERINIAYWEAEGDNREDMTEAFHAANERFGTAKWLLADLGYGLLAWSVLAAFLGLIVRWKGWRTLSHSHRNFVVPLLLISALGALVAGLIVDGYALILRKQVPWWGDSFGAYLFSLALAMLLLAPVISTAALIGLGRRAPPFPLLAKPTPPYWPTALVTLFFLPLLLFTAFMAILFWSPGGWLTSPAGAVLLWLLLNSRAQLIAPRAA